MDFYFMIFTAFAVSIDSFIASAAIGAKNLSGKRQLFIAVVMTVVSIMCVTADLTAEIFENTFTGNAEILGGFILIAIAAAGLLKKQKPRDFVRNTQDLQLFTAFGIGVGVGLDGASATFSLSLSGYGAAAAVTVILFHYLFMELGLTFTSLTLKPKTENISEKTAAVILYLLGVYKLL